MFGSAQKKKASESNSDAAASSRLTLDDVASSVGEPFGFDSASAKKNMVQERMEQDQEQEHPKSALLDTITNLVRSEASNTFRDELVHDYDELKYDTHANENEAEPNSVSKVHLPEHKPRLFAKLSDTDGKLVLFATSLAVGAFQGNVILLSCK